MDSRIRGNDDEKSITAMRPRVFTIPPSVPFLPTLIKALMAGKLGFPGPKDPLRSDS